MADAEMTGIIGPALDAVDIGKRPETACATCPKAMWYRTATRLRAFCRELRHISWHDGEQEPILQCDGREAALTMANVPDA